jgi:hypothetical protein
MSTGSATVNSATVLTGDQWNGIASGALIFANGPTTVAAGKVGVCTGDVPSYVAYDNADGTPANGEDWGPASSDWKLRKSGSSWLIIGDAQTEPDVVLAFKHDPPGNDGKKGSCCAGCDETDCFESGVSLYSSATCPEGMGTYNAVFPDAAFSSVSPDIGGTQVLDYYSGDLYYGPDVTINGSTTRWVLDVGARTLAINLNDGTQICFKKSDDWCCLCPNEMKLCCGPHPACVVETGVVAICVNPGGLDYTSDDIVVACADNPVPQTLPAVAFGGSPSPCVFAGNLGFDMNYDPGAGAWVGVFAGCENGDAITVTLACVDGNWSLSSDACGGSQSMSMGGNGTNAVAILDVMNGNCCSASTSSDEPCSFQIQVTILNN